MLKKFLCLAAVFAMSVQGADLPGGNLRSAEKLPANTYELLVSPSYVMADGGAYLTSELRYQPFDTLGVGFGFGAGELGFNFGFNSVWFVVPPQTLDVDLALVGGIYFNRVSDQSFFVVRATPTVSQTYFTSWGQITPYFGWNLAPSFRL